MGGMALGSILWGQVATHIGIPGCADDGRVRNAARHCAHLETSSSARTQVLDFKPSMDWPAPVLAETPEPDGGPVMVTIEYRVQLDKRAEFVAAMQDVREMRRRNGAYFWELFHDSADPVRFVECFMDESWIEHLRQHERASVADRAILRSGQAVHGRRRIDPVVSIGSRTAKPDPQAQSNNLCIRDMTRKMKVPFGRYIV